MKVTIRHKRSGKEKAVEPKSAKILVNVGRYEYLTRDMASVAKPQTLKPAKTPEVDDLLGENADLEEMDQAQLHELAKSLGIQLHHLTGAAKVKAAIVKHREESK